MDNLEDIKKLNKYEIIQIFNDQLLQFIDELNVIFNNFYNNNIINSVINDDIIFYKNIANATIKYAYNYSIESFGNYLIRNPDLVPAVMSKDLQFIINFNFSSDGKLYAYKDKYKSNLEIQDLIEIIKKCIQHFSEENNNIMFEYLQILSQLTIIYMSKM